MNSDGSHSQSGLSSRDTWNTQLSLEREGRERLGQRGWNNVSEDNGHSQSSATQMLAPERPVGVVACDGSQGPSF